MNITNKYNLPETIVKAIEYDTHRVSGDISVSQLIDAPQIRILRKKHRHEIKEDVTERMWALLGTAMHGVLDRANMDDKLNLYLSEIMGHMMTVVNSTKDPKEAEVMQKVISWLKGYGEKHFPKGDSDYLTEQTLRMEHNGWVLYGTFDNYDKKKMWLYDYKLTGVYSWTDPEARKKWYPQTNVYAHLLRLAGYEVKGISIIAFFRDFSHSKQMFGGLDYPDSPIKEIDIPLFTHEQMQGYIEKRIMLHQLADAGQVPECTDKERWAKEGVFKIKTKGVRKSLRNLESRQSAEQFIRENQHLHASPLTIEEIPGKSGRCDKYCPVRDFCEQRKAMNLKPIPNEQ